MGSKVQAELGNAAEESLTSLGHIAPGPLHCPWTRLPHHGRPKVYFLLPAL